MPRGSKIGERRGGRARGTPNRRTVLADRILAIAGSRPTMPSSQLVDVLVKDQELPTDIRLTISREFLPESKSRSVLVRKSTSAADRRRKSQSAVSLAEPTGTAKSAPLVVLLSVAADPTVQARQRRKAASQAAQYFLPKKPGEKRWWVNAPADEYGFAITPQIAAEYRDIKIELRHLRDLKTNGPHIARQMTKKQDRLNAILHRLHCPCPSRYGWHDVLADGYRLLHFARQRRANITLSLNELAEEAHCTARFDCFFKGAEIAAQIRLLALEEKVRKVSPPLTLKERTDLRVLRLLYPRQPPSRICIDDEPWYQPLRDEPLGADGNLYPPDSKLAPAKEGEIIEEFVDVPPYVIGHPAYPGHKWLWELPAKE